MGLKTSVGFSGKPKSDRVEQPLIDVGNYPARLVQLIDLGVQPQAAYDGQDKPPVHQIMLTYELCDTFMVDKDGNEMEDKPRWESERMPLYPLASERAKSTARYNALDPECVHEGDFAACINTPVMINFVHNKKGDKTYANIGGISAMRPRDVAKCPELKNEPRIFDLEEPTLESFNALPKWIQDVVKGNLNYRGSALESLLAGNSEKKEEKPQEDVPEQDVDDSWD